MKPTAPERIDDTTLLLFGRGPDCPDCGGITHAVTGDGEAIRPWWCKACNLRVGREG